MDLLVWTPIVTRLPSRGIQPNRVSFYVKAELRCIICGETMTVESARFELHSSSFPDHYHWPPINKLKENRACTYCGSISTLPAKQAEKLERSIKRLITKDWIDLQIKTKPMILPFKTHQHKFRRRPVVVED